MRSSIPVVRVFLLPSTLIRKSVAGTLFMWLACAILSAPSTAARGAEKGDCRQLQIHAGHGDLAGIRAALAAGTPIDCRTPLGTALGSAAFAGQVEAVKLLLAQGADVNARGAQPGNLQAPLFSALLGKHLDVAKILLTSARSRVDASNPGSPDDPSTRDLLIEVVDTGDADLVRLFCERAVRVDLTRHLANSDMSALDLALYRKRDDIAEILLTKLHGWHLTPSAINYKTALDVAIDASSTKLVSLMQQTIPDAVNGFGQCELNKTHLPQHPDSLPRLVTPTAPGSEVTAAAFERQGRYLAIGGNNGAASVWDLSSGRKVHEIASGARQIDSIALDATSSVLMWASTDLRVAKLLDLRNWSTRLQLTQLNVPSWVKTPAVLLDDNNTIVSVTGPHLLAAWRVSDCRVVSRIVLPSLLRRLTAGSRARTVAITYDSGGVSIWNPHTNTLQSVIRADEIPPRRDRKSWELQGVTAVAVSEDGTMLATAAESADANAQDIKIWHLVEKPALVQTLTWTPVDNTQITTLSLGWNNTSVLAGDDFEAQIFRIKDAAKVGSANLVQAVDSVTTAIAVPQTTAFLAIGSGAACVAEDSAPGASPCFKQKLQAFAVARAEPLVADDESRLIVQNGMSAARWDLKAGVAHPVLLKLAEQEQLNAVALHGSQAYLGTSAGRVLSLDMRSGALTAERHIGDCPIDALGVTAQSLVVASGKQVDQSCPEPPSIRSVALEGLGALGQPVLVSPDQTITRIFGDAVKPVAYTVDLFHAHLKGWNLESGREQPFGGDILLHDSADSVVSLPDGRHALGIGFHTQSVQPDGVAIVGDAGSSSPQILKVGPGEFIQDVAVDPTSADLAAVASNGRVYLWNVKDSHLVGSTLAENSLYRVALAPGGHLLVTGADNGVVTIRDRKSLAVQAQLLSYAAAGSFKWLVVTPDGHYDSNSPGDLPGVSWVLPADPLTALPVESFMKEYYEPGLLGKVLRGEKLPEVRRLEQINRVQPEVRIVEVQPEEDKRFVSVTVEVRQGRREVGVGGDRKWMSTHQVQDLRLFRDGQLVGYEPNVSGAIALTPDHKSIVIPHIKLPTQGRQAVEFSAYAFNEDWVKSLTDRHTYEIPAGLPERKPRAYVVSIGMDDYENPAWHLNYAANDATEMQRLVGDALERSGRYEKVVRVGLISQHSSAVRVSKEQIKAVLDLLAGHPVTAQLQQSLPQLPQGAELRPANPEDLLLISYSGHGMAGSHGEFYLFPYDTGTGAITPSSLISSEDLSHWLMDVDAGQLTMIIDACESAASVEGGGFRPGPMGSRGLGQLAYDKGMQILAASQTQEAALERPELHHGILSYALLTEGLEEGRADYEPKDNEITLTKWLNWGVLRVPQLYEALAQHRFVGSRGFTYVKNNPITLAPHLQQPQLFDFAHDHSDIVLLTLRSKPEPTPKP